MHQQTRPDFADLKQKSVTGAFWTFGAQGGKLALQMVSVVAMARLLTPEDYGVFGMAAVFTQLVFVVKDLGLSQAAVQKKDLSPEESSALFWINVLFVLALSALCCLLAPAASTFYGDPRIAAVVMVSSLGNVLVGFSAQHKALLQRRLRMRELSIVEIVSKALSLVAGILAALAGLGYWALVLATIADALVHTLLLWGFCRWIPRLVSLRHGAQCLRFGLDVAGFGLLNFFARNLDRILIGKFHPVEAVGFYNKAYQTVTFPLQHVRGPILQVAAPALARLQDDPERFRNYYRRFLAVLAFASMGPIALAVPLAEELVAVVLGDQWLPAAPTFSLLALSALIQPVASSRGTVLVAAGKSRTYFVWGVVNTVCTAIAFAVSAPIGIEAVALAYAVVNYGILYPSWRFFLDGTPVGWADFVAASWRSFLGAVVVVAAGFLFKALAVPHGTGALVSLLSCSAACLAAWALYWLLVPGGRAFLRTLGSDLGVAFSRFKGRQA
ncbi:MAG: lipopolysaccharide biosynthesis protein [Fibrobacterales bacterium]|nr:lipopolysaccharide biosynthesis protein [Fibrobacterales bacterium]